MTRGTVPPPDQVITALRANNDVLRRELFGAITKNRTAFRRGAFIGAAVVALLIGLPAFAQPLQCDTRDRVLAYLADQYGETRRALGIAGEGAVMEMFASDATGTWTLTLTLPTGEMCLMASGIGYDGTVTPAGSPA